MEQIKAIIMRRKWKRIGHTLRRPDGDIAKTALDWNPQGHRVTLERWQGGAFL